MIPAFKQRNLKMPSPDGVFIGPPPDITDLEKLLLSPEKQLLCVPASELKPFGLAETHYFCHKYGLYQLLTDELLEFLDEEIGDRSVIEIGAGNGALSRNMPEMIATDSFSHDTPEMRLKYLQIGVEPVSYGANVLKYEALKAVEQFEPQVVVAAWVTHKYDGGRSGNGFVDGVDEVALMDAALGVEKYIMIGNKTSHDNKPMLKTKHLKPKQIVNPGWLYSRSLNPQLNTIYLITRR